MNSPESFMSRKTPELQSPLGATPQNGLVPEPWDYDHAVFVIWRPWDSCNRCWADFKAEKLQLPEEGDYVCPHTMMKEYKELLKKRTQRLCEFAAYEATTLKNGVIQVSICTAWRNQKEKSDLRVSETTKGLTAPPRPPVL